MTHSLRAVACLAALLAFRASFAAEVGRRCDRTYHRPAARSEKWRGQGQRPAERSQCCRRWREAVPFQGLTSWAAFQPAGDGTMVMGISR
jgi:hypothetical protein